MVQKASSNQFGNTFAFVVVNRQGQDGDQSLQTSKAIRSHVTREARRRKKAGESSDHPNRESPLPFKTGRFRLGSSGNQSKGPSLPRQISKEVPPESVNVQDDNEISRMAMETIAKWPRQLQPSYLLDPFNSLPVSLGSRQQNLLYYYDRHFVQNSRAFNPQRKYLKIAAADPAWLNATFALLALSYNLHTGASQIISPDTLYYRGQALHLVNERLSKSSHTIEDSTIGAVATLCNFDIMSGSLVTATAHVIGLEQLVKLRGGIDKLPSDQKMLLYVISWCDMAYATNWGGTPRFHEISSLAMPPESHISTCPRDETLLPNDQLVEHCPVGRNIYYLSSLFESGLTTPSSRETFSQTLYSTQHTLLHNLSSFRNAASTATQTPEGGEGREETALVSDTVAATIPRRVTLLASSLFIDLALRQLVPQAEMHTIVASRLKDVLCLLSPDKNPSPRSIVLHWKDTMERLLWISFVGGAASSHSASHPYKINAHGEATSGRVELRQFFVALLVEIRDALLLTNLDQMRIVLKMFGWVEAWAGEHSGSLWGEMEWQSVQEMVGIVADGEVTEDRREEQGEEEGEEDANWDVDEDVLSRGEHV